MSENSYLPRKEDERAAGWLGDGPLSTSTEEGDPDTLLTALDALWAKGPPQPALETMRAALDAWWAEQRPTIYYDWFPSPIGRVYVTVSEQGVQGVHIGYDSEDAYLQSLKEQHAAQIVRSPERVAGVMRQLKEYFHKGRHHFDLPFDFSGLTDFQRRVLSATCQVPHGEIVTYKEIAYRVGNPKASRAVGSALSRNPLPILIPCHRVVSGDGSLRGYSGGEGIKTKARLLELEGVLPGQDGLYTPTP